MARVRSGGGGSGDKERASWHQAGGSRQRAPNHGLRVSGRSRQVAAGDREIGRRGEKLKTETRQRGPIDGRVWRSVVGAALRL